MKVGLGVLLIGLVSFVAGLLSVQGALKIRPETLSSHDGDTCAVTEDATAVCWSNHRAGDHGGVYRIDDIDDVVAVQPWGGVACAVLGDRTVSCGPLWFEKEVADGLPAKIPGLVDVENLDASTRGLCAVFGDGTVGCAAGSYRSGVVASVPAVNDAVDVAVGTWAV